jgi:hypothetical protein
MQELALKVMNQWSVENPWIFFGAGGMVVVYLLYMMVRRGKRERVGTPDNDPEL